MTKSVRRKARKVRIQTSESALARCGKTTIAALLAGILFTVIAPAGTAQSLAQQQVYFSIPAQPLSSALVEFGRQANISVAFGTDVSISSHQTKELTGEYPPKAALEVLLENTGLEAHYTSDRSAVIQVASLQGDDNQASSNVVENVAENDAEDDAEHYVDQIVVTAARREQRLFDVPMSVTAIDEAELSRLGASGFQDYARSVPNLSFTQTEGTSRGSRIDSAGIVVRGVASIVGEATTAFYLDDTPVTNSGRIGQVDPFVFDISRVEVLRGPQGTLYGARSMGGAVKIVTNQPDPSEFEAKLDLNLSTTQDGGQNYESSVMFNVPIIEDKLAVRMALSYRYEDGFIDAIPPAYFLESTTCDEAPFPSTCGGGLNPAGGQFFQGRQNINDLDSTTGRISLRWQPTDDLSITARVWHQDAHEDNPPQQDDDQAPRTMARPLAIIGDLAQHTKFTSYSLEIEYDAGPWRIISATNEFSRSYSRSLDMTGFNQNAFGVPALMPLDDAGTNDEFTQEIRFQSEWDHFAQLQLGGFYQERDRVEFLYAVASGSSLLPPPLGNALGDFPGLEFFGGPPFFNAIFVRPGTESSASDVAFFGELGLDIGRIFGFSEGRLFFTAGGRYFDQDSSAFDFADGLAGFPPPSAPIENHSDGFTEKFDLKFYATDDFMIYAAGSKGFRAGFTQNQILPPSCDAELEALGIDASSGQIEIQPDFIWNYETGAKFLVADNRLTMNAAAFYIDWEDIQQSTGLACGFGIVANAGAATVKGFELEFSAELFEGLELSGGVAHADATFDDSNPLIGYGPGDRILQVPEWTANVIGQYNFDAFMGHQGHLRAQYQYVGDIRGSFDGAAGLLGLRGFDRPEYELVFFRAGIALANGWEASLYVDNVFDKNAIIGSHNFGAPAPTFFQNVVQPRTVGINLTKSY